MALQLRLCPHPRGFPAHLSHHGRFQVHTDSAVLRSVLALASPTASAAALGDLPVTSPSVRPSAVRGQIAALQGPPSALGGMGQKEPAEAQSAQGKRACHRPYAHHQLGPLCKCVNEVLPSNCRLQPGHGFSYGACASLWPPGRQPQTPLPAQVWPLRCPLGWALWCSSRKPQGDREGGHCPAGGQAPGMHIEAGVIPGPEPLTQEDWGCTPVVAPPHPYLCTPFSSSFPETKAVRENDENSQGPGPATPFSPEAEAQHRTQLRAPHPATCPPSARLPRPLAAHSPGFPVTHYWLPLPRLLKKPPDPSPLQPPRSRSLSLAAPAAQAESSKASVFTS